MSLVTRPGSTHTAPAKGAFNDIQEEDSIEEEACTQEEEHKECVKTASSEEDTCKA